MKGVQSRMLVEELFLAMLRHFIEGNTKEVFRAELDREEWECLWKLAGEHHVLPIIHEEIRSLESFLKLPAEVQESWKKSCVLQVVMQMRATDGFLQIYREFLEAGLEPLVVKGIVCRELYRKPDYRISGDEDVLIRKEQFPEMDGFLLEHGFSRAELEKKEIPDEMGYYNAQNGLYLEIHTALFAEDSGAYGHLNGEFKNVFAHRRSIQTAETEVYTLADTEHLLYLLCHCLKHFLHGGFGIRQVMDIVVMMQARGSAIDWAYFDGRVRALKLDCFWEALLDIGQRYLGLSLKEAFYSRVFVTKPDSEALLEDILGGGIYGGNTQERKHSANMTLHVAEKQSGGRIGGIVKSLFPSSSYMKGRYPYVGRHAWLLPAAWAQRIFEYGRERGENKVDESALDVGTKRIRLMEKYGLTER